MGHLGSTGDRCLARVCGEQVLKIATFKQRSRLLVAEALGVLALRVFVDKVGILPTPRTR